MNTLFIRLEGPMQSWGTRSRWGERDTAPQPTKSGVIGLLACALGWGKDRDADIRALAHAVRFGVRIDHRGSVLSDYHTVIGGVRSADGKIKINANTKEAETVVSTRAYLCDASFLAALQGPEDKIAACARAIQVPVWPLFLGRRSCPASMPFFAGTGEFESLRGALLADSGGAPPPGPVRLNIEAAPGTGFQLNDEIDSLARRTYLPRYVTEELLELEVQEET